MTELGLTTHTLMWRDRTGQVRAQAELVAASTKSFWVRRGALVFRHETPSFPSAGKSRRLEALKLGLLADDGKHPDSWRLTQDREFSSLSGAAQFVIGQSAQGPKWWVPVSTSTDDSFSEVAADSPETALPQDVRQALALQEVEKFIDAREGYMQALTHFQGMVVDMLHGEDWRPPFSISARLKGIQSLLKKLTGDGNHDVVTVNPDSAKVSPDLTAIKDIIGVRVTFYSQRDMDRFNSLLRLLADRCGVPRPEGAAAPDVSSEDPDAVIVGSWESLAPLSGDAGYTLALIGEKAHTGHGPDTRDRLSKGPASRTPADSTPSGDYYKAHHWWWVYQRAGEEVYLAGSTYNLEPLSFGCELQVVHVIDHVVNEVFHDRIYKERLDKQLLETEQERLNTLLRRLMRDLEDIRSDIEHELVPLLEAARER